MELLIDSPDDTVSEVLRAINVRSAVYCLSELRGPWGFRVVGAQVAKFHLVIEGSCWLELDGHDPRRLTARQLVLLPHGDGHTMRDEPGSAVRGLDRILDDHPPGIDARMAYGGDGPLTRLLCGGFSLAAPLPPSADALLPDILHLDASAAGLAAWLEPVFALLRHEAEIDDPGATAVLAKIADVFLTQALRSYLVGSERAGLLSLRPLLDPAIGKVVDLMHRQPSRPWTVAALAQEAGMSRTSFSTRFRAMVGETPMRHLAHVRLGVAAGHLATTDGSIFNIAQRSGYDNDASLSKAFKRRFGVSPGEYRRHTSNAPLLEAT